ncbi:hypothetical protein JNJ66_00460 [Candidatus Saccharibacteria bacterium]|nr:hypothetical protein [Candidatus Saccharibacteria bacterium]
MKLEGSASSQESIKKAKAALGKVAKPLKRQLFFIFVLVLLGALAFTVYTTATLFSEDDEAYRQQKQTELTGATIKKDPDVIKKIEQLQTADTEKIDPNFDPTRDNPFEE